MGAYELEQWLELGRAESVLPVLCGGAWEFADPAAPIGGTAAAPQVLRGILDEPRYLDLRWAADEPKLSLRQPRFRDAIGELAAAVLDVAKDELVGEEINVRRRRARLITVGGIGLAASVAAASFAMVSTNRSNSRADVSDRIARSRALAGLASQQDSRVSDLSMLLAAEAVALSPTPEAIAAGTRLLQQRGPIVANVDGAMGTGWRFDLGGAAFGTIDGQLVRLDPETVTTTATAIEATGNGFLNVSPDGTKAIVRDRFDAPLRILDVATGEPQAAEIESEGFASEAAFSTDGLHLLVARDSGVVERFALANGELLDRIEIDGFQDDQSHVEFAADGSAFAVRVNDSSEVAHYPVSESGVVGERVVFGAEQAVSGLYELAIAADGSWIAVALSRGEQTTVAAIEIATGHMDILGFFDTGIGDLSIARNDTEFTVGISTNDGSAYVVENGNFTWDPLVVSSAGTWATHVAPDGRTILAASTQQVAVAHLDRSGPIRRLIDVTSTPFDATLTGDEIAVLLREGVLVDDLSDDAPAEFAVDLALDGVLSITLVRLGSSTSLFEGTTTGARRFDLDTQRWTELVFADRSGGIWRPTAERALVAAKSPTSLALIDPATGEEIIEFVTPPDDPLATPCCLAVDPTRRWLVWWALGSGTATVVDLETDEERTITPGFGALIQDIEFISGPRLAVGTLTGISVVDVHGDPALPFSLPVRSGLAFSAFEVSGDGRYVVIGGGDTDTSSLTVVDVESSTVVVDEIRLPGQLQSIDESDTGGDIVAVTTSGVYGVAATWNDPVQLIAQLCDAVTRRLSDQERASFLPSGAAPTGCTD